MCPLADSATATGGSVRHTTPRRAPGRQGRLPQRLHSVPVLDDAVADRRLQRVQVLALAQRSADQLPFSPLEPGRHLAGPRRQRLFEWIDDGRRPSEQGDEEGDEDEIGVRDSDSAPSSSRCRMRVHSPLPRLYHLFFALVLASPVHTLPLSLPLSLSNARQRSRALSLSLFLPFSLHCLELSFSLSMLEHPRTATLPRRAGSAARRSPRAHSARPARAGSRGPPPANPQKENHRESVSGTARSNERAALRAMVGAAWSTERSRTRSTRDRKRARNGPRLASCEP